MLLHKMYKNESLNCFLAVKINEVVVIKNNDICKSRSSVYISICPGILKESKKQKKIRYFKT